MIQSNIARIQSALAGASTASPFTLVEGEEEPLPIPIASYAARRYTQREVPEVTALLSQINIDLDRLQHRRDVVERELSAHVAYLSQLDAQIGALAQSQQCCSRILEPDFQMPGVQVTVD